MVQAMTGVLDHGYRVLVDKDHLARDLKPPTYTAHIPKRPTEKEYQSLVEEFWWETIYVAKNLWRDELTQVKYNLDTRTWSEFAGTYVGEGIDENWDALFETTALFRRMAKEVGDALGYGYPSDLDERVTSYLQRIRDLER